MNIETIAWAATAILGAAGLVIIGALALGIFAVGRALDDHYGWGDDE